VVVTDAKRATILGPPQDHSVLISDAFSSKYLVSCVTRPMLIVSYTAHVVVLSYITWSLAPKRFHGSWLHDADCRIYLGQLQIIGQAYT
jgi:hypothetical protein